MRICIFCDVFERDGGNAVTPVVCVACSESASYPLNFAHTPDDEVQMASLTAGAVIRGKEI